MSFYRSLNAALAVICLSSLNTVPPNYQLLRVILISVAGISVFIMLLDDGDRP